MTRMLKSKLSTLALAIALTALGCLLSQLCPGILPAYIQENQYLILLRRASSLRPNKL